MFKELQNYTTTLNEIVYLPTDELNKKLDDSWSIASLFDSDIVKSIQDIHDTYKQKDADGVNDVITNITKSLLTDNYLTTTHPQFGAKAKLENITIQLLILRELVFAAENAKSE